MEWKERLDVLMRASQASIDTLQRDTHAPTGDILLPAMAVQAPAAPRARVESLAFDQAGPLGLGFDPREDRLARCEQVLPVHPVI